MAVIEARLFEVYILWLLLRIFLRVKRYLWMRALGDSDQEIDRG